MSERFVTEEYRRRDRSVEATVVVEYHGDNIHVQQAISDIFEDIAKKVNELNDFFVVVDSSGAAVSPVVSMSSTFLTNDVVKHVISPYEDF